MSPEALGISALGLAAAHRGDLAEVRSLLAECVDVDASDSRGWTALMMAALYGRSEVVGLLLDKGADVNARMATGGTPLMFASMGGRASVVRTLLSRGADADAKDEQGKTAADFACMSWQGEPGSSPKDDILKLLRAAMKEPPAQPLAPAGAPAPGRRFKLLGAKAFHLYFAVCLACGLIATVVMVLSNLSAIGRDGWPVVVIVLVMLALWAKALAGQIRMFREAPAEAEVQSPVSEAQVRGMRRRHSRKYPLLGLAVAIGMLGMTWYDLRQGRYNALMVAIAPALLLLSLGGLVDPDLMWGMRVKDLPLRKMVVSYVLFFAGAAAGVAACLYLRFGPP